VKSYFCRTERISQSKEICVNIIYSTPEENKEQKEDMAMLMSSSILFKVEA
jgi:hypothetical protein